VAHIQNKGLDTTDARTAAKINMAGVALLVAALRSRGLPRHFPLWALALPLGASAIRGFMIPALKIGQETAPNPMFAFLIMASLSTLMISGVHVFRRATLGQINVGWLWFVASGAMQLLGLFLMAMALRVGDVTVVATLSSIAPVWALLYGALMFRRETLGARHVAVAVLVVVGGILLVSR
jgi:drug/metabolite transporter (DMT)-like permease